ncbi:MAG TPA: iron-sulfur cluster-binding domain-containing protein, partial [Nevskiaceae bacterium]|nr:iron-sulfur cluster-binding domain-containing protein [Nevskiaceae bacterium]
AGGSGITPVYSIIRSVLARGRGRVRLVYANRDENSVIFGKQLSQLSRDYPERLQVIHWLDRVQGFATQAQLAALAEGWEEAEVFVCGPGVFMDNVAAAMKSAGVPHAQVHIERFVSLPEDADDERPAAVIADGPATEIEAELDGKVYQVQGAPGQLLLESLEAAGIAAPFSCRAGACAACMCHLEEGDIELIHNHVLSDEDMQQGWVLACQAVPASPKVRVKYPS